MKNKAGRVLTMRINKQEDEMVKELKQKYSVNISQFIRNKIVELYRNLNKKMDGGL